MLEFPQEVLEAVRWTLGVRAVSCSNLELLAICRPDAAGTHVRSRGERGPDPVAPPTASRRKPFTKNQIRGCFQLF